MPREGDAGRAFTADDMRREKERGRREQKQETMESLVQTVRDDLKEIHTWMINTTAWMVKRDEERAAEVAARAAKRAWHETIWGRASIIIAALAVLIQLHPWRLP